MSTRLSGTSLFTQALSNLTTSYNVLAAGTKDSLTLEDIINPSENVNKYSLNATFQSYLSSNFGSIDSDADGKITASDIQLYSNKLTMTGMTYSQLTQLCATNGTSTLLDTVMSHFDEIDVNHDGRVTNAEIKAYGVNKEIDEMKDNFPKFDLSAMSVYYDTSASQKSETTDKSSAS